MDESEKKLPKLVPPPDPNIIKERPYLKTHNYDSPDGKDCPHKMLHTAKVGAVLGLTAAFYDVTLGSQPKGFWNISLKTMKWVYPAMGIFVTYSATSCVAGQIREKDDPYNHAIGGTVAGFLYVLHRRRLSLWPLIPFMGFVGGMTKVWKDNNYTLLPKRIAQEQGPFGGLGAHKRHHGWRKDVQAPAEY